MHRFMYIRVVVKNRTRCRQTKSGKFTPLAVRRECRRRDRDRKRDVSRFVKSLSTRASGDTRALKTTHGRSSDELERIIPTRLAHGPVYICLMNVLRSVLCTGALKPRRLNNYRGVINETVIKYIERGVVNPI